MIRLEKPLSEGSGQLVAILLVSGRMRRPQCHATSIWTYQMPRGFRADSLRLDAQLLRPMHMFGLLMELRRRI